MTCGCCGSQLEVGSAYCPRCGARQEGVAEQEDYIYDAFISYRHLPADRNVAVKLQRSLENFRVPRHLREAGYKPRIGKFFRDEDELPTSGSLTDQIHDALARSRYLIVVCSPQTRESLWALREVELFASLHGRDRICVALIEGEPDDSFPPLLLTRLEAGEDGEVTEVDEEPLAADFRNLTHKKFQIERLRIAATIIGCGYDELRQRMRSRRLRTAAVAASVVAAVSIAFGAFSLYQQTQISGNLRQAQQNESEFLANEANELLSQGDRMQAIQVALAGLPKSSESNDRPFVPAAQVALENALEVYPGEGNWRARFSIEGGASPKTAYNDEGQIAVFGAGDRIEIYDLELEKLVVTIDPRELIGCDPADGLFQMRFVGKHLIYLQGTTVACFDAEDASLVWKESLEESGSENAGDREQAVVYENDHALAALSEDASSLAVVSNASVRKAVNGESALTDSTHLRVLDVASGHKQQSVLLDDPRDTSRDTHQYGDAQAIFVEGADKIAVANNGAVFLVDLKAGTSVHTPTAYLAATSLLSDGKRLYAATIEDDLLTNKGYTACIEAFDMSLKRQWARDEKSTHQTFDGSGWGYEQPVRLCEIWHPDGHDARILTIAGYSLELLDPADGSVAYQIKEETPFEDARVIKKSSSMIQACTAGDDVIIRDPVGGDRLSLEYFDTSIASTMPKLFIKGKDHWFMLATSNNPNRYRVYRRSLRCDVPEAAEVDGTFGESYYVEYDAPSAQQAAVFRNENAVDAYRLDDFSPKWSVPYSRLKGFDATRGIRTCEASDGGIYLLGNRAVKEGQEREGVVFKLSMEDGQVQSSAVLSGVSSPIYLSAGEYLCEYTDGSGAAKLAMASDGDIVVFDASSGAEERRIAVLEQGFVSKLVLTDSCFVASYQVGGSSGSGGDGGGNADAEKAYALSVFSRDTGEKVSCDLAECAPAKASRVVVNGDGTRVAVACEGGELQLFDGKGNRLWTAPDAHEQIQYLEALDPDVGVLLQDASGYCLLLDGATGEVVSAATTALPPINATYGIGNDDELQALFKSSRVLGTATISLDREAFGPKSIISEALLISSDGGKVLAREAQGTDTYFSLRRYTLDELIELAKTTVKGHELTDRERYLYQIDTL